MKKPILLRFTMILVASLAIQYAISANNLCFSNDECMNMNVFECITNPIKCFKCIIQKIKELGNKLGELSEGLQSLLDAHGVVSANQKELAGYIAAVNQHIKYLLEELETVKQSYTSKKEFEEQAQKFNRELSTLQGNLEKVTQRVELIEKPVTELTKLKTQIERQIEKAEQQILIMENYRDRIDGMDAKIHELETALARHKRQIRTNKTVMWFLAIGVIFALTSQK